MTERLLKVVLNPKLDPNWFKQYIFICKCTSKIPFIQIYNGTGFDSNLNHHHHNWIFDQSACAGASSTSVGPFPDNWLAACIGDQLV